ncbi:MAG: hypothetical protein EBV48_08450, partial [Betaproteobacteria bacterium]|nr:hypothetical protein [Betaproteobacteria bacterium]
MQAGGGASDKYAFNYLPGVLTVTKVPVVITLGNLAQSYTGQGLAPDLKTSVPDLGLTLTYGGSAVKPVLPGSYAVVATPSDANYSGSATGTLVIQRAEQQIVFAPFPVTPLRELTSGLVIETSARGIALVVLAAVDSGQSVWLLLTLGVFLPFATWNAVMGFVVFVHHTHPSIAWFQKRHDWQRYRAYLTSTAHVKLPFGIDRLLHNIMEHNAHHLNPRIPMYSLRRAQRMLEEK